MEIKEKKALPVANVREFLEDGEEPDFHSKLALEHSQNHPLSGKKAKELVKKLMEIDEKINEEIATKIVDVLPRQEETVKAILLPYKVEVSKETIEKILEKMGEIKGVK